MTSLLDEKRIEGDRSDEDAIVSRDLTSSGDVTLLDRVKKNPLFPQLQAVLIADCSHVRVPYTLVDGCDVEEELGHIDAMSAGRTDCYKGSGKLTALPLAFGLNQREIAGMGWQHEKEEILERGCIIAETDLRAGFRELACLRNSKVLELERLYNSSSAQFIAERSELVKKLVALHDISPQNPPLSNATPTSQSCSPTASVAFGVEPNFDGLDPDLLESCNWFERPARERLESELRRVRVYYRKLQRILIDDVMSQLSSLKRTPSITEVRLKMGCAVTVSIDALSSKEPIGVRPSRALNAEAVKMMNTWYERHVTSPYPSDDEKEEMARLGGISVAQVKAWFANKRNRTMNTRPKRQKQAIQQYLQQQLQPKQHPRPEQLSEQQQKQQPEHGHFFETRLQKENHPQQLKEIGSLQWPHFLDETHKCNRQPLASIQSKYNWTSSPETYQYFG